MTRFVALVWGCVGRAGARPASWQSRLQRADCRLVFAAARRGAAGLGKPRPAAPLKGSASRCAASPAVRFEPAREGVSLRQTARRFLPEVRSRLGSSADPPSCFEPGGNYATCASWCLDGGDGPEPGRRVAGSRPGDEPPAVRVVASGSATRMARVAGCERGPGHSRAAVHAALFSARYADQYAALPTACSVPHGQPQPDAGQPRTDALAGGAGPWRRHAAPRVANGAWRAGHRSASTGRCAVAGPARAGTPVVALSRISPLEK